MPVATSFGVLNYSGMLYGRGDVSAPLFSMAMGRRETTNSVKFLLGQTFTEPDGEIPAISENASLTAPDPVVYKRDGQKYNVTQIFQYTFGVSYAKQSNMGTLAPTNIQIAGQQANPINELDFQSARCINKARLSIEKTFIQGKYKEAADDDTANQTRGLDEAITTNVFDAKKEALGYWKVAEYLKSMHENNVPTEGLTLWITPTQRYQICADAEQNGLSAPTVGYTVNGINVLTLQTPYGAINFVDGKYIPDGEAFILNLPLIHPVEQPVPEKGNFFVEQLAKTGAGDKYQMFGQMGLDYTAEFFHGKIKNLKTTFEAPKWSRSVYIAGQAAATAGPGT